MAISFLGTNLGDDCSINYNGCPVELVFWKDTQGNCTKVWPASDFVKIESQTPDTSCTNVLSISGKPHDTDRTWNFTDNSGNSIRTTYEQIGISACTHYYTNFGNAICSDITYSLTNNTNKELTFRFKYVNDTNYECAMYYSRIFAAVYVTPVFMKGTSCPTVTLGPYSSCTTTVNISAIACNPSQDGRMVDDGACVWRKYAGWPVCYEVLYNGNVVMNCCALSSACIKGVIN